MVRLSNDQAMAGIAGNIAGVGDRELRAATRKYWKLRGIGVGADCHNGVLRSSARAMNKCTLS